jgi:hypothetical protein
MPTNDTFAERLLDVSIGQPQSFGPVTVFPVFGDGPSIDITTNADGHVIITERADAEVPTLVAENTGGRPVLLTDGEVVEGGRQTRTINVSILIASGQTTDIPVSCIEAGRWKGTAAFRPGRSDITRRARRAKTLTVGEQVRRSGSKRSDQGAVWHAIEGELTALGVASDTRALSDAFDRFDGDELGALRDELVRRGPRPGQRGVIIAHGRRIVSAELFATRELLAERWSAVVSGILLDVPAGEVVGRPSATKALRFLARLAEAESTRAPGVGLGTEFHVRGNKVVGQALVYDDVIVHASMFAVAA